ncbi:hypothetical protein [Helicobacter sp. 23-1045]
MDSSLRTSCFAQNDEVAGQNPPFTPPPLRSLNSKIPLPCGGVRGWVIFALDSAIFSLIRRICVKLSF